MFIQIGRRGGDQQPGREDSSKVEAGGPSKVADCGRGHARLQLADPTRWWLAEPMAPHSCIDKRRNGRGEKQTAQPRAPAQGNKASNL